MGKNKRTGRIEKKEMVIAAMEKSRMRESYSTVWYCHLPQKTWSVDPFCPSLSVCGEAKCISRFGDVDTLDCFGNSIQMISQSNIYQNKQRAPVDSKVLPTSISR